MPVAFKALGQLFTAFLCAAGNHDACSGLNQSKTNGPGRAAGAKEQNRFSCQIKMLFQGAICAQPVGIESFDGTIIANQQGIDRADLYGHWINLIKPGNHSLLMGNGDAHPFDAQDPETIHGRLHIFNGKSNIDTVKA